MAGIVVLLALAVFIGLAILNERVGRRMLADAMTPTASPVRPVAASWGHPSTHVTAYRTYASTTPVVRRYERLRSDVGAGTFPAPGGPVAIEIEHRQPHRTPDLRADVGVPLSQAIATAVIVALLVGILGLLAGRADALKLAAGAFAVTLAGAWLWRLGVVTSLLQVVETVTRADLDGDGHTGRPPEDEGHVMVRDAGKAREAIARETRQRERAVKLADLVAFVNRAATGGTSEAAMAIRPGERDRYVEMRNALLRLGIAAWKNPDRPKAGWVLTVAPDRAAQVLQAHVEDL